MRANIERSDSVLDLKEKIAFFAVNVGNIPIMTMLGTYLLLYYTDVVGLNPVAIGTLMLIARVMDGISDPVMGYLIDHLPRLKLGRFRGYLVIGVIITTMVFLLVWLGPLLAPTGKLVIAYISYLLIGWAFDLMDIPLNSMIPVMSDRDRDRTILSTIKGSAYMVGAIIIIGAGLPIIKSFPTMRDGFVAVILGVAVFVLGFSVLGALGIKERIQPVKEEKYHFRNILEILGARPVLVLFLQTLISQIGAGVSSGTMVFFFLYGLKRPDLFPIGAASYIVGIVVAAFTAPALVKRFGKKTCNSFSMVLSMTGSAILFFTPTSLPYVFLAVALLTSPATGLNMVLTYGIQADNVDYVEWKHGYRAEAAVASMNSFIIKAASGVGSAIGAYLLAYFKYVPNAENQLPETIRGLYTVNYAIPAVFTLIGLLVWILGYPLTKTITAQMMAELAERRQVGSNPQA